MLQQHLQAKGSFEAYQHLTFFDTEQFMNRVKQLAHYQKAVKRLLSHLVFYCQMPTQATPFSY